ncbi:hypothetical protein ANANG_G00185380 [Anguilla anguilla]|uniref:Raftlin-like n=1 Tax=Anguilla anguilla TaxID=7936 RepID=A0A9D3RXR6_ANGAN|nr:hypothetical protein ANANG_G00185380 [Anguilla anguilla]
MGCGLHRLKRSEEDSPGKIYSTLRRPQVETKVGVAYTYRFLDFLLGNAEGPGSSTPCLSSVRELPGQLQDLYLQGFLLAALHPFVHPCGPPNASLQRQLYRAVLIRPSHSVEECESRWLEIDVCQPPGSFPDNELVQGCVKKVHDAAEQGSMFVGFVQQVAMVTGVPGQGDGDDYSLSLHSSPSSFLRDELDQNQNPELWSRLEPTQEGCDPNDPDKLNRDDPENQLSLKTEQARSPTHMEEPTGPVERTELFSLFNHQGAPSPEPARFYTLRVPLRLEWRDAAVSQMEAGWLDHMTQHFSGGASLVDGYFHLGTQPSGEALPETVEGVFVFQEGAESDSSASAFDAIVVEQWTVIQGVQVKTDYVPLLQSLALYGWRLTCVLPTPIANRNSDGSLFTKQILFLQRPVLHRKRREIKRLSLNLRSKSNKNCEKDAAEKKNRTAKKPTPCATPSATPKSTSKELEAERRGQPVTIEEAERRAEREDSERVGRKNDKNRQNEREKKEREAEPGKREAGAEPQERGGGAEALGHAPLKPDSAGCRSREDPEGGVTVNEWAELAEEPAEGGVTEQLGGGVTDGPGEPANEGLGEVEEGRARQDLDSDCILLT